MPFPLCHMITAMTRIPVDDRNALATAIRTWRLDAGLSQAELARRMGTTQSAVSRWEQGHDEPRLGTLSSILRTCGLTATVVVEEDVDRAQIRQRLAMTPRQRLEELANVSRFRAAARAVS